MLSEVFFKKSVSHGGGDRGSGVSGGCMVNRRDVVIGTDAASASDDCGRSNTRHDDMLMVIYCTVSVSQLVRSMVYADILYIMLAVDKVGDLRQ